MRKLFNILLFCLSVLTGFNLYSQTGADCATAITVSSSGCSAATAYNNTGITGTISPSCIGAGNNNAMWFKFVASAPTVITTVNGGSLSSPTISLLGSPTSPCTGTFPELACTTSGTATGTLTSSALTVGSTYYIVVDGANNNVGTFQLCLSSPATPSNDSPCNAINLPANNFCSPVAGYTNLGATGETLTSVSVPGCFDVSNTMNSVFFTYTAIGTNNTITINGGTTDMNRPQVAIISPTAGCNGTAYTVNGCAQAASGANSVTLNVNNLIAGTTYYILVDGYSTNTGAFQICVNSYVPTSTVPNDECAGAIPLCPNMNYMSSTNGANSTNSISIGSWACNGVVDNDVWFKFTTTNPVQPINFNINTTCSADKLQFEVFEKTGGGALCTTTGWTSRGCVSFGPTGSSTLNIPTTSLTANTTYYLVVDNWPGQNCDFNFTITGNQGADAGVDQQVCINAAAFNISGATPAGGTWSGPGITNAATGTFNPATAGLGSHVVYYTQGSCTDSKIITVSGPTVTVSNDVTICSGSSTDLIGNIVSTSTYILSPSVSPALAVPDNGVTSTWNGTTGTFASSTLTPTGLNAGFVLNSVTVNITHTWDSELIVYLTNPCGNSIKLINANGGSGDNFTNTIFSSTATAALSTGTAPFTGTFIPADGSAAWTTFLSCATVGAWTLTVGDKGSGDLGTLQSWSMNFTNPVPPTTYTWSPTTNMTNSTTLTPTVSPTATTTYTLTAVDYNGCTNSDQVIVTVATPPTASISGTTSICSGNTATITFTGTANATVTYNIGAGANQTILLNGAGTASITTAALTSTTTYNIINAYFASNPTCLSTLTGSAVITVNPIPTASFTGTTTICSGNTTVLTFTGTANATVTFNNGASNLTVTLDGSGNGTYTTPVLTSTTTYTLVSVVSATTPTCTQTLTGNVVVTVNAIPTGAISGTTTICSGNTAVVSFTGTPNAIVTYNIDNGTNQTITLSGAGIASITTPVLTATTTYNIVSVELASTPNCIQTLTGSATITVNSTFTINVTNETICSGQSATLVASGATSYLWQDGTPTASFTASPTTTTTYSVTGSTATCTGSGTGTITVVSLPTATITGTTSICSNTSTNLTINGTPNAIVTYNINGGANQTVALDAIGNASLTSASLTANTTYTLTDVALSGSSPCSATINSAATITVIPLPTATISGTTSICSGTSTSIAFTGTANSTVTFSNGTSNLTVTLDGTGNGSYTTPNLTFNTTYSLVSVTSATTPACTNTATGNAIITINAIPNATISGDATICTNNNSVVSFSGTPNATITYNIDGGASQTIVLNGSGSASLTTPNLTSNSIYTLENVVSSDVPSCTQSLSSFITITVANPPTATIAGNATICSGTNSVINFSGTPNATVSYHVDSNPNTTILLDGTGVASITTPNLTVSSTYTLVSCYFAADPTCSTPLTDAVTVTVNPLPNATISGTITVCQNDASPQLTFTGSNGTAPYIFSYTINNGLVQTLNSTGNTAIISVPTTVSGTFSYDLVSVSEGSSLACSQNVIGNATVTVNNLPSATITGSTTLCENQSTTLSVSGTPNATVTYTDGASTNTLVLNNSGLGTITTPVLTSSVTYTLTSIISSSSPACSQTLNSFATVTVNPAPSATISGISPICYGTNTTISFNGTPNATVSYNDGTSNLTIVLDGTGSGSITTPNLIANNVYTLVSVMSASNPSCSVSLTEQVLITVLSLPDATISGNNTICSGSTSNVTISGTPNAVVTYNNGSNLNITLDNSGLATITTPALTSPMTYNLVSIASSTTPSCTKVLNGSATISIISLPNASISGIDTVCVGGSKTVTVTATANSVVAYSINGGTSLSLPIGASGTATLNTGSLTSNITYTLQGVTINASPFCAQPLNQSVQIVVEQPPVVDFIPDTLAGCAPLYVTFTNLTANAGTCTWSFGDGTTGIGLPTISKNYDKEGCYDITLTVTSNTPRACTASKTYDNLICVEGKPVAHFNPFPDSVSVTAPSTSFYNSSQNAVFYQWSFGDGSTSDEVNPVHTYNVGNQLGYYAELIAISEGGCKDTFDVYIKVFEELIFYIPNTFTPDGDNFNQTFRPIFSSGINPYDFNLQIFNRWGELIFESKNPYIGWDGTYGGKIVQEDVYTYKIVYKIKHNDDRKLITGHVSLLK